jgi:hypothetical protein
MEGKRLEPAGSPLMKTCIYCGQERPIGEFRRRTGRRAGPNSRRGACRECRRRLKAAGTVETAAAAAADPAMAGADGLPAREPAAAKAAVEADKPSATAGSQPDHEAAADPAMAGAGGLQAREPAAVKAAVEADKPSATAGSQPDHEAAADAGEPAPAPGTERKRKKRRGKRGGRKRNRRRKARAAGAAAEPAADPAVAPAPGTEPERPGGRTPAQANRAQPTGRKPAAGPKPAADADQASPRETGLAPREMVANRLRPLPPPPPRPEGPDPSVLSPGKSGVIWMRGRTDKGRRWRQETDLETAVTLVREYAAVVVNRRTIRRLYSNKAFREYILKRDNYTCYFCGGYGDTIDHIVPRAKGGHTTPLNCVTACRECNQNKAALDLEEFIGRQPPRSGEPT